MGERPYRAVSMLARVREVYSLTCANRIVAVIAVVGIAEL
jgi:hypothetical protein